MDIEKPIGKVTDKLEIWFNTFVSMIPNMLVAILLFIVFLILAKLIRKVSYKLLLKTDTNQAIRDLFTTIVYYLIIGLGLFVILGILKLDKTVTSLLAGVGVIGLALGFAFQDIMANFISGIILAIRTPFYIGSIIEVKSMMGIVTETNLRATVIKTFQGQQVHIPNKDVLQNEIINYSVLGERRIDLEVGISYGDDLEKVEKIVLQTIKKLQGIIRPEDIIFDYSGFGDSSIIFNIRFWIKYPDQPGFLAMRHSAVKAIKKAFDQEDVTIPFPIRTLDFGIKGGEKLSDLKVHTVDSN